VRVKDHANGDVENPRLMPQDELLERVPIAAFGLRDQVGVLGTAFGDLAERVVHGRPSTMLAIA
jgi:hypothetical protein